MSTCGSEYFKSPSSLRGHRWWEATVCCSPAARACWWVLSTSALTQTYCASKSQSSHTHTPLLPSRHEYLNAYTYMHTTRPALCLTRPQVKFELSSRGDRRLFLHQNSRRIIIKKSTGSFSRRTHALLLFSPRGYRGHKKCWGVSTLMHLRSQTDDTPPDLSVHLPPQSRFTALFSSAPFARGALFSSVLNELNGRAAKGSAHSKRQIYQRFCDCGGVWTEIWSDGFWVLELGPVTSFFVCFFF